MNGATNNTARPLPARAAQIAVEARAALARRAGVAALPAWPTGQLVEIEPGVKVVPVQSDGQARILVLDLEPAANGMYQAVARVRGKRVRLSREGLPALGITASYKTLRRLITAGFVRGEQPAPGVVQMDLASYFEHERATADPEFWTRHDSANTKRLRLAVAGTSYSNGHECRSGKKSVPAGTAPAAAGDGSAASTLKTAERAP
jgi:hypothetical protein